MGFFEFSSCIIATASGFVLFHFFLFRLMYNIAKPDFDYIRLEDKFYNLTFKDKLVYSLEKKL